VSAASASATACGSRSRLSRLSLSICNCRTAPLSTLRISIGASSRGRNLLTPITACAPESMRAWVRAAASSMRSLGSDASIARVMPPSSSTSRM
jgi:hypothetical protein